MTRSEKTQHLRVLYDYRCGYCGIPEARAGGVLTRDHFKPLTKGGRNSLDNLVYSCERCNRAKGNYWGDTDESRLLHPKEDDLAAHVSRGSSGEVIALSQRGSVYISVLELNIATSL